MYQWGATYYRICASKLYLSVQFSSMLNLIKPIECNFKGMNVFESPSIKLPEIWVSLKGISHLEMKYSSNIESCSIQNKRDIKILISYQSNFLGSLFSIFCWLDDAVVEPRLRGL